VNSDRLFSVAVPLLRPVVRATVRGRRADFLALPALDDRVVLLGDSITQGGVWEELLPDLPVANRGINGDTTGDVLARLDDLRGAPRAISLLIGTNDLHGSRGEREVAGIAARTGQIVAALRRTSPHIPLVINGVTPRTELFTERISALNEHYRRIADEHACVYLDTWPALADPTGALRAEYTRDHLHLTVHGYLAWAAALRPHLGSPGEAVHAAEVEAARGGSRPA
jgi:lysophospholipase L1-like esterase